MKGKRRPPKQRDDLALAVATGGTVAGWAKANGVPERTAREWAGKPDFKALVDAHRKAINDRTVGGYVRFRLEAINTIATLMRQSADERVKLAASRAILEGGMEFEDRQNLIDLVEQVEERLDGKVS